MTTKLQIAMDHWLPELDATQREACLIYCQQLLKWNQHINLTAITNPEDVVIKHLLDSFAVAPFITATRLLDVGSGAGLPGIPLAIIKPECKITCLDTNSKKTRFIQQMRHELGLQQLEVVHSRVEQYQPDALYDAVITRAFAKCETVLALTKHVVVPEGCFYLMKGQQPITEIEQLPAALDVNIIPINVPGLDAERCLIILKQTHESSL